jgi:hypothetical protein
LPVTFGAVRRRVASASAFDKFSLDIAGEDGLRESQGDVAVASDAVGARRRSFDPDRSRGGTDRRRMVRGAAATGHPPDPQHGIIGHGVLEDDRFVCRVLDNERLTLGDFDEESRLIVDIDGHRAAAVVPQELESER